MSTKFTEVDLDTEVDDMDAEDARETLSQFMEVHEQNKDAYDNLSAEFKQAEEEYEQTIEDKEERIAEFKTQRAEEASDYVKMPADLLAERFTFSELDQIIEEGSEFSEEDEESEEDDEMLTTFAEKEEKGRTEGGTSKYRDRASTKLSEHGLPVRGE